MRKIFVLGIILLYFCSQGFSAYKWEQTSGPATVPILSLVMKGDTLFAGLLNGGIFRSCDNGQSWKQSDSGLEERETVTALLVSNGNIFASTKKGVYISTDNGNKWTLITSKLSIRNFSSLASIDNKLFVGTEINGVYLSSDNGRSWSSVNSGMNDSSILCLAVSGTTLFAGTHHSVYYSTNSGSSWKKIYEHEDMCFKAILEHNGILLVGANPIVNEGSVGVLYSSGKFDKWTASEPGLKYKGIKQLIKDGNTIYAATWGDGIFFSNDTGKTWKPIGSNLTCNYVNTIVLSGSTFFAGTDGGIFKSSDKGTSWALSSSGIARTYVIDLEKRGETIYAATERYGVFYTKDNGNSWTQVVSGLKRWNIYSLTVNSDYIFCGTDSAGIFRNSSEGEWSQLGSGIIRNIPILYLNACGSTVFAKNISEIYKTTNNGDQWSNINSNFPRYMGTVFITNKNTIFCGGDSGIYRSDDNGVSWKPSNNGISNVKIISLANIGDTIFAGSYLKGVFRSLDNGATWEQISPVSSSIEKLVTIRNSVIALTSTSIFISKDKGNSWETINSTLNAKQLISLNANSDYLFVGTRDDGVWRLSLRDILPVVVSKEKNTYLLNPVIINTPYSENINIKFQLPRNSSITIEFFNINGKKILYFKKDFLPSGNYSYTISKLKFSPGCYCVNLKIDGKFYSTKILISK